MKTAYVLLVTAGVLALSACSDTPKAQLSPTFGNTVRHNMQMHIINPDASEKATIPTDLSGTRAKNAMDRYNKGEVIEPEAESTSAN